MSFPSNFDHEDQFPALSEEDAEELRALNAWYSERESEGESESAAPEWGVFDETPLMLPAGDDSRSGLSREDLEDYVNQINADILGIDAKVREEHPHNVRAQAEAAKKLKTDLVTERNAYAKELKSLDEDEKWERLLRVGNFYGFDDDEANANLATKMSEIIADANTRIAELKDEIAERIRLSMAELANVVGAEEVHSPEVRDAIYEQLVKAGLIHAFEPIDTNY